MNELRHCPYCGGKGIINKIEWTFKKDRFDTYAIICKKCMTSTKGYFSREEAIRNWNDRKI